jgi:hypothetical protein
MHSLYVDRDWHSSIISKKSRSPIEYSDVIADTHVGLEPCPTLDAGYSRSPTMGILRLGRHRWTSFTDRSGVGWVIAQHAMPRRPPTEPFAMPSHHGVGPDEYECGAPVPPRASQYDPKLAVSSPEMRTVRRTFECLELLAECEVLEDELVMSAAGQPDGTDEERDHV